MQMALVPIRCETSGQVESMMRALALEEGCPLTHLRGPGKCPWNFIFHPKANLLSEAFLGPCPWQLHQERRVLEVKLELRVLGPALMLCLLQPCALCRLPGGSLSP